MSSPQEGSTAPDAAAAPAGGEGQKPEVDAVERKKRQLENLGRSGGVYIPPFKLARMQAEAAKEAKQPFGPEVQRQEWEALRKSINGLVNKVSVGNIKDIVRGELFTLNLLRGKGLFARAVLRAQMASPGFTHVYAALVAVVNSRLPEVGELIADRTALMFRRAYARNDKIVLTAACKMLAHLMNQKVISEFTIMRVCLLFLEELTTDSVEVCCQLLTECGQVLQELNKKAMMILTSRLRKILHEGQLDNKRVQYAIENFFSILRQNFAPDHIGVVPELELIDEEDQYTHDVAIRDGQIDGENILNIFRAEAPEQYKQEEGEWRAFSKSLLEGESSESEEESDGESSSSSSSEDSEAEEEEEEGEGGEQPKATQEIVDYTEQATVDLRRTVYLCIMSSVNFEECVHKILSLNIREGQEKEICTMLIDCCAMERTFNSFYALQAERLCRLVEVYRQNFEANFLDQYETCHRMETNKIRNVAKFYGHLLASDAISWEVLKCIQLTEETTTSATRIFIKNLFQYLSEVWGLRKLYHRLNDSNYEEALGGVLPKDTTHHMRFAINFFSAIGLGALTKKHRQLLQEVQAREAAERTAAEVADGDTSSSEDESSSDDDSSSSSSESDFSSSGDSESESSEGEGRSPSRRRSSTRRQTRVKSEERSPRRGSRRRESVRESSGVIPRRGGRSPSPVARKDRSPSRGHRDSGRRNDGRSPSGERRASRRGGERRSPSPIGRRDRRSPSRDGRDSGRKDDRSPGRKDRTVERRRSPSGNHRGPGSRDDRRSPAVVGGRDRSESRERRRRDDRRSPSGDGRREDRRSPSRNGRGSGRRGDRRSPSREDRVPAGRGDRRSPSRDDNRDSGEMRYGKSLSRGHRDSKSPSPVGRRDGSRPRRYNEGRGDRRSPGRRERREGRRSSPRDRDMSRGAAGGIFDSREVRVGFVTL